MGSRLLRVRHIALIAFLAIAAPARAEPPKLLKELAIQYATFHIREMYLPFGRTVPADIVWDSPLVGEFTDADGQKYSVVVFRSSSSKEKSWYVVSRFNFTMGYLSWVSATEAGGPPEDEFEALVALNGKDVEF